MDEFCRVPGAIADGSNADVACDHYHRLEQDLDLLVELGVNAYRFSISWPRVQPLGTGEINPHGLGFYERLVDGLLDRGIQPYATLYHWDLPLNCSGGMAAGWRARLRIGLRITRASSRGGWRSNHFVRHSQ
jgi:beta-glucosidase